MMCHVVFFKARTMYPLMRYMGEKKTEKKCEISQRIKERGSTIKVSSMVAKRSRQTYVRFLNTEGAGTHHGMDLRDVTHYKSKGDKKHGTGTPRETAGMNPHLLNS
uniref:Uncharacterized protein n=1 Tax=Trypanosoma vivax (strain Y486) TaxID=1055687 RepID=G0U9M6_TRYVY|nr:hypothetical protein, unlikely [Trypanosoma vivax Y486]